MTPGVMVLLAFIMTVFGFIAGVAVKDEKEGGWYGGPAIAAILVMGLILLLNLTRS